MFCTSCVPDEYKLPCHNSGEAAVATSQQSNWKCYRTVKPFVSVTASLKLNYFHQSNKQNWL